MKFSFIVPAYNVRDYITKCVTSITTQIEKEQYDIEVIVVDDGSPDSLYTEIEKLSQDDNRIKLIRQKNKGLSGARNTGMKSASGDYFFFIDGDDFLIEGKLADLLEYISESQSDFILFGAYGYIEGKGKYDSFFEAIEFPDHESLKGTEALKYLLKKDYSYGWCVWHIAFKKNLIKMTDSVFPEGKMSEDVAFMLRLWLAADSVSSYEDYVYAYRRDNAGSITHTARFAYIRDLADNMVSNLGTLNTIKDDMLKSLLKLNYQTLVEVILFCYSAYSKDERKMLVERLKKLEVVYEIPENYYGLLRRKEKLVYIALKLLGYDVVGKIWGLKRKL